MINKVKIIIISLLVATLIPAAISVNAQPVDLRVVVDISGDVRKVVPDRQHLDAINLLVNQLPPGSKAGIWTYGKYVNHLVWYDKITPAWLSGAADSISKIRSVASRRDIFSALKNAAFDIDKSSPLPRHILLLSSGDIDVSDDAANIKTRNLLLNSLLPEIMNAGIKVHTLSLSEKNGTGLLRTLSRETGGFSLVARNPESIIYFSNTLAGIFKPDNYIPIDDSRFAIDANVIDFTAILFGSSPTSFSLIAPDGKIYSSDTDKKGWLTGKHYARFKLNKPALGQWKITGDVLPDSRVFVRASNTLEIDGLTSAYVTSENILVSAVTKQSEQDAIGIGFSEDARFDISIDSLDETSASIQNSRPRFSQAMTASSSEEGVYQTEIQGLSQEGLYKLRTVAKTLDYERGLDRLIQINELFKMDVSTAKSDEKMAYKIQIIPSDNNLMLKKTTVVATVTDSAGKWNVRTIDFKDDKSWQLTLDDDNQSTEFKVELDFRGTTFSGREVHYRPKPLIIELAARDNFKAVAKPSEDKTPSGFQVEKSETIPAIMPDADLSSSPKGKISEPLPLTGAPSHKQGSNVWILIIGFGFVIGSAIIFFYFWRSNKQPNKDINKTKEIVKQEAVGIKPLSDAAQEQPPLVKEVVSPERIKAEKHTRPAPELVQPAETVERKAPAEKSVDSELSRVQGQDNEEDFEIDIDFDAELTEETELASEWRDLDAESNLSPKVESDLDIEFEVDDTDERKTDKKA